MPSATEALENNKCLKLKQSILIVFFASLERVYTNLLFIQVTCSRMR
jgi:hypothetical protein